jgi:predicted transcriptional regulator
MNWNFDAITPQRPALEPHTMRLDHHALKWVKDLARRRHAPLTRTIRELLAQTVAHWRKEGHTSGSPWGNDAKVGLRDSDVTTVMLDDDTVAGLHEIMAVSDKTLSRLTSEILLDAMVAETEAMQANLLRKKTA